MSRLTLRLPETLHQQLAHLAEREGVSLNQYIVYSLTRQIAPSYTVEVTSAEAINQQQAFSALRKELGELSLMEAKSVLAQREVAQPEEALSPDIIARFQQYKKLD
jgi:regulator of protease activity HflC (stomatin/prohibitin superfamily)